MITAPRWTQRLGLIDLGSNSARLVVIQYTPGESFKVTYEYSRRVRLAEGMAASLGPARLRPAAVQRAIETLAMFRDFCAANGVRRLIPVATAATRDAADQADFLRQVRAATGLRLRVLSGEEEAYFGALGVINGLGLADGVVIDVGGGSAEVSRVRAGRFAQGQTTPLGAVRLTEAFLPGERASAGEVKRLNRRLDETLAPLEWLRLAPGERLVGLGGTIRALARLDRDERDYPVRLLNGYEIEAERLLNLIERLRALPVKDRPRQFPGLPPDRADVILGGALVVAAALRATGADRLMVSDQGLRDGLFYREFLAGRRPARGRSADVIPDLRRFSVLNLGRVYGYQTGHADQVARLAEALFDETARRHGYGAAERQYVWAAAQLSDIGSAVNYQDHHKHSAYLILSAGLPGYTHREVALIALLCLYHHKGKADFKTYQAVLEKGDGERVRRLGALLRLAEALDSGRTQAVAGLTLSGRGAQLTLRVTAQRGRDISWEVGEAGRSADLFEAAYGCRLEVRAG